MSYTHNQHLIQYFHYEMENVLDPALARDEIDPDYHTMITDYLTNRIDYLEAQCKEQVKNMRKGKSESDD